MSILVLYAGDSSTLTANNKLPSPSRLQVSVEQIWSEDTGRAQSGANQAKMIGSSLTSKHTYAIEWAMLEYSDYLKISDLLPRGFFYFGIGNPTEPPSNPSKYYRSEISYEIIQVGTTRYYKNIAVQVIEQ